MASLWANTGNLSLDSGRLGSEFLVEEARNYGTSDMTSTGSSLLDDLNGFMAEQSIHNARFPAASPGFHELATGPMGQDFTLEAGPAAYNEHAAVTAAQDDLHRLAHTATPPNIAEMWAELQVQRQTCSMLVKDLEGTKHTLESLQTRIGSQPIGGTEDSPLEANVRALIHTQMRAIMGCEDRVRRTDDPDEVPFWELPDTPVGVATSKAPDGVTDLMIPDWKADVTAPRNDTFIDATVLLVQRAGSEILDPERHTAKRLKAAAQTYFRTLKTQRRLRLDKEGQKKVCLKRQSDRRASRKKHKTDEMRKAVPSLRKYLGYDATIGLPELINTDWVSSEWSTAEGDSGTEERTRLREAQGAPEGSWEIRTRMWVEPQIRELYAACNRVRSAMPVSRSGKHSLMNPASDGIDYTDAERAKFQRIVKQDMSMRPRTMRAVPRFRGRPEPKMHTTATRRPVAIYRECISKDWASKNAENQGTYTAAPSLPNEYTVLKTPIPEFFISEADKKWITATC